MDAKVAALVKTGRWEDMQARRGILNDFRCEYCDRDLFADVEGYMAWTKDHIVPIEAGGLDTFENIAIACHSCNAKIKGKWNPATVCKSGAGRDDLVRATRDFVRHGRERYLRELQIDLQIVRR